MVLECNNVGNRPAGVASHEVYRHKNSSLCAVLKEALRNGVELLLQPGGLHVQLLVVACTVLAPHLFLATQVNIIIIFNKMILDHH